MEVKFLKDHLDNKKGDTTEVDEARANYWEMVGVAEKVDKAGDTKEKKEGSPVTAKKVAPQTKKK